MSHPLLKRVVAEAIGTAMLLAGIVGSGIMGERLAADNIAIALLANTLATGAALVALILTFGPISGAHFNPAVTLADAWQQGIRWSEVPAYIFAQLAGAFAGVAAAHVMFGLPLFFASHHARSGGRYCFISLAGSVVAERREVSHRAARWRLEMIDKQRVLILCTGNSARSQMAEGLLRDLAGDRFEVASAGVSPTQVRPEAIAAMQEAGIDISQHRSKSVDEFMGQEFDYVITVCDNANEQCPVFPAGTKRIHWSFADPAAVEGDEETRLAAFRRVRDEILQRLRLFVAAERGSPGSSNTQD